jgi:hypothetical protein
MYINIYIYIYIYRYINIYMFVYLYIYIYDKGILLVTSGDSGFRRPSDNDDDVYLIKITTCGL